MTNLVYAESGIPNLEATTYGESYPQRYLCRTCAAVLVSQPEYTAGDYFIRCFGCGVKNILGRAFEIIGVQPPLVSLQD